MSQYGSFSLRLLAHLFDLLLLWMIPLILLLLMIGFSATTGEIWLGWLWIFWEMIFLQWLLIIAYQILTFLYFRASLGKLLAGLEISKEDGTNQTLFDALLRFPVGYAVSSILWGLGFFWMIKDPKKKGFHDHIARTVVVKKQSSAPLFFGLGLLFILTISISYTIYTLGIKREIWGSIYSEIQTFWQYLPSRA